MNKNLEQVQEAIYKVGELIVKSRTPYTIGQPLLMPVCLPVYKW
jgi:hypothetical protein